MFSRILISLLALSLAYCQNTGFEKNPNGPDEAKSQVGAATSGILTVNSTSPLGTGISTTAAVYKDGVLEGLGSGTTNAGSQVTMTINSIAGTGCAGTTAADLTNGTYTVYYYENGANKYDPGGCGGLGILNGTKGFRTSVTIAGDTNLVILNTEIIDTVNPASPFTLTADIGAAPASTSDAECLMFDQAATANYANRQNALARFPGKAFPNGTTVSITTEAVAPRMVPASYIFYCFEDSNATTTDGYDSGERQGTQLGNYDNGQTVTVNMN